MKEKCPAQFLPFYRSKVSASLHLNFYSGLKLYSFLKKENQHETNLKIKVPLKKKNCSNLILVLLLQMLLHQSIIPFSSQILPTFPEKLTLTPAIPITSLFSSTYKCLSCSANPSSFNHYLSLIFYHSLVTSSNCKLWPPYKTTEPGTQDWCPTFRSVKTPKRTATPLTGILFQGTHVSSVGLE